MKLIIVGPRGKMGKPITEFAYENEEIEIIGGVGPAGRDYIGKDIGEVAGIGVNVGAPVVDDIEEIIDDCDVIIDFSTVEMGMKVLEASVKHGKALVNGTTGYSAEQRQAFEDAGKVIPVMLAANTSKLVNTMYKLLEIATKIAGSDMDIEILDMHDNKKLDAPSGTAKEMGELIAGILGVDFEEEAVFGREGRCPRQEGNIGFHSIRGGDISSSHTVYFVGAGERLEITHHSQSFRCFAKGAVEAAVFMSKQPVGCYTIKETFGL